MLEPGKLLVVTSGVGITPGAPGRVRKETDPPMDSPAMPRRPEQAAQAVAAKDVHVAIVRLPQVHDTRKQGLVTRVIQIAREKGVSAYVGDGANRWAAGSAERCCAPVSSGDRKYVPGMTTYHAVQEEGASLRDIVETIGKGLKVPLVSIPAERPANTSGCSSGTRQHKICRVRTSGRGRLGWEPTGPRLLEDLTNMKY